MNVYFDNSATTKPYDEVIDVMADTMKNYYGNPSSAYNLGVEAERKLTECRCTIAQTINASKDELLFTSGGSESNNFLIRGFAKQGTHVITSSIEHPSVRNTCKSLEKSGVRVTYLDVDEKGRIDMNQLENAICKDTVIVSIMHVNNEIGTIQDIETIGKIIKEKSTRAKFHVDAVQSYGKLNIDVKKCKIDLMSASGHKVHGPRGIGFAYIRKGLCPEPLIYGGGQEFGLRSGTENLAADAGFAFAAKKINQNMETNYEKVKSLKEYFINRLNEIDDIRINSPMEDGFLPHILSVSFKGVRGEVLLHSLEGDGISVSTGSACSAHLHNRSEVMEAIKVPNEYIDGTIRFSFNEYNTKEEVDYVVESLKRSTKFLRRLKI